MAGTTNGALFDNEKWVKENIACLRRDDANFTFRYVALKHPLMGMAFRLSQPKKNLSKQTVEQLSLLADAVTVCCFELIGSTQISTLNGPVLNKNSNKTAIGNLAYVALHHSDPAIRKTIIEEIELWRGKML